MAYFYGKGQSLLPQASNILTRGTAGAAGGSAAPRASAVLGIPPGGGETDPGGDGGGGTANSGFLKCKYNCYAKSRSPQELQACLAACKGGGAGGDTGETTDVAKCKLDCATKWAGRDPVKLKECLAGCEATKPPVIDCGKGPVTWSDGKKVEVEGCPCTAAYYPTVPGVCSEGYHAVGVGADARCECDKYTGPGGGGGGGNGLGEYQFPPGLLALLGKLQGRASSLLDMKPGFNQKAISQMFGLNFDKLRGAGAATNAATENAVQKAGLLGTGAGMNAIRGNAWNTEKNVGDIIRQIFLADEGQKRTDLQDYTGMASNLTGQQMTAENLLEAINSSRRGEGQAALAMLMQYLQSLMSSWGA